MRVAKNFILFIYLTELILGWYIFESNRFTTARNNFQLIAKSP